MSATAAPCTGCGIDLGSRYGDPPVCWSCWSEEHGGSRFEPEPEPLGLDKLRELDTLRLLTTAPRPLEWLAEGIWAPGKLTLFGGREKTGKSLVQLMLATTMAAGGGEVAGIPVKASKVLLIDAENGEEETHRRLRATQFSAEHAERLVLVEARGFDLRFDLEEITALVEAHQPDIVLCDSLRELWRGDERKETEVVAALSPLRDLAHDTGVAISLTHHAQKGGSEYRGSSAIGAAVDWCVMLGRVQDDSDRTRRKLANPLARFAREREDRWLSISAADDDGPVSLLAAQPHKRSAPRDEKAQKVLDALTGSVQSGREIERRTEIPHETVRRILGDLRAEGLAQKQAGGWVAQT